MTLAEFLQARMDEYGPGRNPEVSVWAMPSEALRMILARYEDCLSRIEDPEYSGRAAKEQAREYEDFVLPHLGAAWSGHRDYRQEWKP